MLYKSTIDSDTDRCLVLSELTAVADVSKGMLAVKLSSNKILQSSTGGFDLYTGCTELNILSRVNTSN